MTKMFWLLFSVPTSLTSLNYELWVENNTVVKSFNHPYQYPMGYEYTLNVKAPLGCNMIMDLIFLDIEILDYLNITDPYNPNGTSDKMKNISGTSNQTGYSIVSYMNSLQVTFYSSAEDHQTGNGYVIAISVAKDLQFLNKTKTEVGVILDSCDNSTCWNGGRCSAIFDDGYKCVCTGIYTGLICAWTYCDLEPCLNGGICSHTVSSYNCTCADGYNGKHCETDIELCSKQNCNENGQCVYRSDWLLTCECFIGWTGTSCMDRSITRSNGMVDQLLEEPFWIGIIVVLGVLAVTGTVIFVRRKCLKRLPPWHCCHKKTKSTGQDKDKYNWRPSTPNAYSNQSYSPSFSNQDTPESNQRRNTIPSIKINIHEAHEEKLSDYQPQLTPIPDDSTSNEDVDTRYKQTTFEYNQSQAQTSFDYNQSQVPTFKYSQSEAPSTFECGRPKSVTSSPLLSFARSSSLRYDKNGLIEDDVPLRRVNSEHRNSRLHHDRNKYDFRNEHYLDKPRNVAVEVISSNENIDAHSSTLFVNGVEFADGKTLPVLAVDKRNAIVDAKRQVLETEAEPEFDKSLFSHRRANSAQRRKDFVNSVRSAKSYSAMNYNYSINSDNTNQRSGSHCSHDSSIDSRLHSPIPSFSQSLDCSCISCDGNSLSVTSLHNQSSFRSLRKTDESGSRSSSSRSREKRKRSSRQRSRHSPECRKCQCRLDKRKSTHHSSSSGYRSAEQPRERDRRYKLSSKYKSLSVDLVDDDYSRPKHSKSNESIRSKHSCSSDTTSNCHRSCRKHRKSSKSHSSHSHSTECLSRRQHSVDNRHKPLEKTRSDTSTDSNHTRNMRRSRRSYKRSRQKSKTSSRERRSYSEHNEHSQQLGGDIPSYLVLNQNERNCVPSVTVSVAGQTHTLPINVDISTILRDTLHKSLSFGNLYEQRPPQSPSRRASVQYLHVPPSQQDNSTNSTGTSRDYYNYDNHALEKDSNFGYSSNEQRDYSIAKTYDTYLGENSFADTRPRSHARENFLYETSSYLSDSTSVSRLDNELEVPEPNQTKGDKYRVNIDGRTEFESSTRLQVTVESDSEELSPESERQSVLSEAEFVLNIDAVQSDAATLNSDASRQLHYHPPLQRKHPLRDSAYQSKEQSTDYSTLSRSQSTTVSPTLTVPEARGFDQFHILNAVATGPEDKKITNQLELAAKKLALLSEKERESQKLEQLDLNRLHTPRMTNSVTDTLKAPGKSRRLFPSRMLSMIADQEEPDNTPARSPKKSPVKQKPNSLDQENFSRFSLERLSLRDGLCENTIEDGDELETSFVSREYEDIPKELLFKGHESSKDSDV